MMYLVRISDNNDNHIVFGCNNYTTTIHLNGREIVLNDVQYINPCTNSLIDGSQSRLDLYLVSDMIRPSLDELETKIAEWNFYDLFKNTAKRSFSITSVKDCGNDLKLLCGHF